VRLCGNCAVAIPGLNLCGIVRAHPWSPVNSRNAPWRAIVRDWRGLWRVSSRGAVASGLDSARITRWAWCRLSLGRPACESPRLALLARTGGVNWRLCDCRQARHDGAKGLIFGAGGDMPPIQKLFHRLIIHARHEDRAK